MLNIVKEADIACDEQLPPFLAMFLSAKVLTSKEQKLSRTNHPPVIDMKRVYCKRLSIPPVFRSKHPGFESWSWR